MSAPSFEWDEKKNDANIKKHRVSFFEAQRAFFDRNRVVAEDLEHSQSEKLIFALAWLTMA